LVVDFSTTSAASVKIVLTSVKATDHIFVSNTVEAGNNGIISIGTLILKGKKPAAPILRLKASTVVGEKTLTVDGDITDWNMYTNG
jgi:hypothetical protein